MGRGMTRKGSMGMGTRIILLTWVLRVVTSYR